MRIFKLILSTFLVASMGGGILTAAATEVEVSNGWVKESIPGSENGAGYFTITNVGTETATIVGAATSASRAIEVHQHILRDGMMRMRRVPELAIAPNETVVFQPGGYHLMLFGVKNPFRISDNVEFTLKFSDGDEVAFQAEVKSIR